MHTVTLVITNKCMLNCTSVTQNTLYNSGVGTKSILRGRGELEAQWAELPEPRAGYPGKHRLKLVKNCCRGAVDYLLPLYHVNVPAKLN